MLTIVAEATVGAQRWARSKSAAKSGMGGLNDGCLASPKAFTGAQS